MTPAERLRAAAQLARETAEAATPGPWSYNGYSMVGSRDQFLIEEEFWESREDDGHTYDHRLGQTCPACGERPAIYSETAKPEVRGQRFGTYWDCARHKDAYDVDGVVAKVPSEYGDTATGRHARDATHIALWSPPVALAVAAWLEGCAADLDALMQYTPPNEALAVADALLQTQPVKP